MSSLPAPIYGTTDPAFKAVRDAFASNFEAGLELGAALSISIEGRNVVDLWGGYVAEERAWPWGPDTVACTFSCSKGIVAVLALLLVEQGRLDLDAPVAQYWPEFAQAGKDEIPVRWLLTHEAGVSAITKELPYGALSDWDLMVEALAEQEPLWTPGEGHGYHGVTYGHLVGEVIRRVTGGTVGQFMRAALGDPLHVDLLMPLPVSAERRTAAMVLGDYAEKSFFSHWGPDDLGPKSFGNPPEAVDPNHANTRAWRDAEIPMGNIFANAHSLDRVYSMLACNGSIDGKTLLSADLVHEGGRVHVSGMDRVMQLPTAFGLGFEHTIPEWQFGPNPNTYGHNGSGGSLGMVDPDAQLSLGYVMNRMVWGETRDDPRWPAIFDALYGSL